jgi:cytochrome c oxidase assembly protein subunit 15
VPPSWSSAIAIHYAHRVGALLVTLLVLASAGHVMYHQRGRVELRRPALMLCALLVAQITLGALTVLSGKQYVINSLHVVTGAMVLATSLVLTLRAYRPRFARVHTRDVGVRNPAAPARETRPPIPETGGARA